LRGRGWSAPRGASISVARRRGSRRGCAHSAGHLGRLWDVLPPARCAYSVFLLVGTYEGPRHCLASGRYSASIRGGSPDSSAAKSSGQYGGSARDGRMSVGLRTDASAWPRGSFSTRARCVIAHGRAISASKSACVILVVVSGPRPVYAARRASRARMPGQGSRAPATLACHAPTLRCSSRWTG
jgi:hypothetical protein